MRREEVLLKLRMHEPMLRALGIEGLSLFGSVARQEADCRDVDLAAKFSETFSKGGLDYFGRLEEVESRLSQILGGKVDLVEEPARKRRLQLEIDRDRAVAF